MSVFGPRIPVSIYLYREDPILSTKAARRRTTSAELKRRSVSSMKGLLPLALPANCSSSPDTLPTDATMEGKVDEYFPEMLARDLEISSAVFAAKNMTAGTPTMSLWGEEKTKPRAMSCPSRMHPSISERPYHTGSSRVQTLGAIEERDCMVSFIEHQRYATDGASSDAESIASTESSVGIEPPSIRLREQSIITAATSLTSTSGNPPSPKDLLAADRAQEYSWIDIDSDDDGDLGEDEEALTEEHPVALSPRPRTPPPCLDSHLTTRTSTQLPSPSRISHHPTYTKNGSSSCGPPIPQRRQHSVTSINVPLRGASLMRTSSQSESNRDLKLASRESRTSTLTQRRSLQICLRPKQADLGRYPRSSGDTEKECKCPYLTS